MIYIMFANKESKRVHTVSFKTDINLDDITRAALFVSMMVKVLRNMENMLEKNDIPKLDLSIMSTPDGDDGFWFTEQSLY